MAFMSSNFSFPLLITMIIAAATLIPICSSQNLPADQWLVRASATAADYVSGHNQARAADGVGPVTWNTTLEAYAQNYANSRAAADCALVHSGGPYGENLAWGTYLTGTGAVNLWVAEKPYYDYNTNTCATGKVCGHYTQVVWSTSVRIGCARAQCANNANNYFIICSYDLRGNYVGQKPY